MLIREVPIRADENIIGIKQMCVITKDEFLACYNEWVKEASNEQR